MHISVVTVSSAFTSKTVVKLLFILGVLFWGKNTRKAFRLDLHRISPCTVEKNISLYELWFIRTIKLCANLDGNMKTIQNECSTWGTSDIRSLFQSDQCSKGLTITSVSVDACNGPHRITPVQPTPSINVISNLKHWPGVNTDADARCVQGLSVSVDACSGPHWFTPVQSTPSINFIPNLKHWPGVNTDGVSRA